MGNIAILLAQYLPLAIQTITNGTDMVEEIKELLGKANAEGRDVTDAELAALKMSRKAKADAEAEALEGNA